ncbi:MAG: putative cyclase [Solirubrobacterales bacterium]|nr:putative cyclase [Solirubrobacterales bacterium]
MTRLPSYDELPVAPRGGGSAWGLFGSDDDVGLFNVVTPDVTRAAAQLVQTGEVFPLDAPLNFFDPPLFERSPLEITIKVALEGRALDEVYNGFNPQASSQWDALSHVAYDTDAFYNGASLEDVVDQGRNSIASWAERGIATRGVLLDLERTAARDGRTYDPGSSHAFSVDDLESARIAAGVEFRPGDVMVLRTGFTSWYESLGPEERVAAADRTVLRACGVEHTEDMARYLWNSGAVAVACDCPALEVWPMDRSDEAFPFGMLHRLILAQFGMAIGELWALDALAAWCDRSGRHEFFLTSAPLNSPGGIGSPANALAIV